MSWENTPNENLFIAICALRLDRSCSAGTYVELIEEVERRLNDSVPKSAISKLVGEMDKDVTQLELVGQAEAALVLEYWKMRHKELLGR